MAHTCPNCGSSIDEGASGLPAECPHCHTPLNQSPTRWTPTAWETAQAPFRKYFGDLWQILTKPSSFFRKVSGSPGISWPLAFALITHWLGKAFEFLWHSWIGDRAGQYFSNLFQVAGDIADVDHPGRSEMIHQMKSQVIHWFWGAGSVIADPFITLFSILFTSFFVFIGARILVSTGKEGGPREVTYESALQIVCFGMGPAIFAAFPLIGGVISSIWVVLATIIGARTVYRIGTGRAIVVALFPKLLFLGIIIGGVLFLAVALLKLLATAF